VAVEAAANARRIKSRRPCLLSAKTVLTSVAVRKFSGAFSSRPEELNCSLTISPCGAFQAHFSGRQYKRLLIYKALLLIVLLNSKLQMQACNCERSKAN
jgi:hypothetical protein